MDLLLSLISFLLVAGGGGRQHVSLAEAATTAAVTGRSTPAAVTSRSTPAAYWQAALPGVPMPPAIIDLLASQNEHASLEHMNVGGLAKSSWIVVSSDNLKSVKGSRKIGPDYKMITSEADVSRSNEDGKEISVSYGENAKEALQEISVSYGQDVKEAVKEISVSYGSEDVEKALKHISASGSEEDVKKISVSYGKEALKEISISYGEDVKKALKHISTSGNEEDVKKTSVSYGEEALKEISVSYGEDVKKALKHISTTVNEEDVKKISVSYGEEALKKISVSYGEDAKKAIKHISASQNQEDVKEISVSYGEDVEKALKNISMSYDGHGENDDIKEISVSYGVKGQEDLKEISVSYGSENNVNMKRGSAGHGSHSQAPGEVHRVHAHVSSHEKPSMMADVFFFHDMLRPGSKMTPIIPPTSFLPALLPRHVAEAIPFSIDRLPDILTMFTPATTTSPAAATAREIRWTLETCEHRRRSLLPGERAGCATCLESLADLAASLLGTRDVRAFSAGGGLPVEAPGTLVRRGRHTVTAVRRLAAPSGSSAPPSDAVTCHDLTYPYAVFYCHTSSPTAAYAVTLRASGDDGDNSEAAAPEMEVLAVCHLDTSQWSPDHPFFVAHGVRPGDVAVCHFLSKLSIVWVRAGAGDHREDASA